MNDLMKDVTSVAMAIVGVAILAVLVSQRNQTGQVIQAASGGFANVLGVAMGGGSYGGGLGIGG
jgi:membrane DNA delivery protein